MTQALLVRTRTSRPNRLVCVEENGRGVVVGLATAAGWRFDAALGGADAADHLGWPSVSRILSRPVQSMGWNLCAPRGALSYPQPSWEEFGGTFLGLMPYPESKDKWEQQHGRKSVVVSRRRERCTEGPA